MDNATRTRLLQRHKMSGFPGSIIDVFKAYDQGIDLIGQYMQQQQQQMQVANTPQEQQQGLRPAHQAGNTNASMAFPNTPPNASFNTVGMKAPIDMKQFDETGNLVKSYDAVPPGVKDLKMSSQGGTVIETPAQMQFGGFNPGFTVPLIAKGLLAEGKRRIADNIVPSGYASEEENKLPGQRLYDAVVLNQPEPSSRADLGPRPENPSREYLSMEERRNILGYVMGQHNDLPLADYRPTEAQDTDAVYFKSPTTEQNLRDKLESQEDALRWINWHTANGDRRVGYHTGVQLNVLGNYILDKGKDDKGHYISYYDVWDLDPFRGRAGKAVSDAVQSLAGVRSPEIYGRIYYDPETGKPITEKKQAGGVRKYQSGDFWTPVSIANYMGETKGGEPERFFNFADSTAYHESWHSMDPYKLQSPKKGYTVEDMEEVGGKGAYQIESRSLPAYWQRMKNLSDRESIPLPDWYNPEEKDARNLSYDQQKVLFMVNMLEHEYTNMGAYGRGEVTSADQWAKGWKGDYDDDDIRSFEASMAKARKEGITLPKGAQPWPSTPAQQPIVAQEAKQDSTKEEVPLYLEMWNTLKSYLDYKNGGVRKFQGGSTPGKLVMDGSGNIISVDLNAPTHQPVQSTPKPTEAPKPKSTPKPTPKPAPKPVRTEPEVIPGPPITLPPAPRIETPIVTPRGTIAPENRNRVNYDTPDISRAIRRNVDIYTGAAAEEGWYNAEDIAARNKEWSQLPYEQMIAASRAAYRPEDYYLISDNEKGTYGVYQGGRLVTEYEGLSGRNAGDAITAVPHPDGRPDYSAGNLTSGAGEFFLSNQYATSEAKYNYAPSFNFSLPNGNEQAMAIHGTPEGRLRYFENDNTDDNRQSYGCINGLCGDLKELFEMNLPKGTSWYSLPEEDRNKFEIIDGIPYLRAGEGAMKEAQTYTDAYGRKQRGQGMNTINRTKPGYREIRANIDMDAFKRDIFDETGEGIAGWFENTFTTDTTDEEEFAQTTQPFVDSLVDNKQAIMQATGVSNDQYNLVAKLAFGILGTESTFGNTNSDENNAVRFTSKLIKEGAKELFDLDLPLPDTNMDAAAEHSLLTELFPRIHEAAAANPLDPASRLLANVTDKDPANYSLGPTQLRWNTLIVKNKKGEIIDTSELDLVRSLGVNGPEDLNDPQKAAIATAAVLAHRINNRRATLDAKTDEELIRALAGSWNNGPGYADKAIKNSQYLTIQQKDRMKLGGRKRSKYFSVQNRKSRK